MSTSLPSHDGVVSMSFSLSSIRHYLTNSVGCRKFLLLSFLKLQKFLSMVVGLESIGILKCW